MHLTDSELELVYSELSANYEFAEGERSDHLKRILAKLSIAIRDRIQHAQARHALRPKSKWDRLRE